eukprot:966699-Pyramimonas_sp.AAC.1
MVALCRSSADLASHARSRSLSTVVPLSRCAPFISASRPLRGRGIGLLAKTHWHPLAHLGMK